MATYLADTNLLLRLADPASPQHPIATSALTQLFRKGEEVYITPQNLIEFWAVATRPFDANGFGWSRERTAKEVADLQERFPLLPDSPEMFVCWLGLVTQLPVHGKRVHDARLVSVLQAYGVGHLITFNVSDFAVFPSLSVIDPRSLATRVTDA
jgi:predicted nucleic acid-binding protein